VFRIETAIWRPRFGDRARDRLVTRNANGSAGSRCGAQRRAGSQLAREAGKEGVKPIGDGGCDFKHGWLAISGERCDFKGSGNFKHLTTRNAEDTRFVRRAGASGCLGSVETHTLGSSQGLVSYQANAIRIRVLLAGF
jgi:hypothetical protein